MDNTYKQFSEKYDVRMIEHDGALLFNSTDLGNVLGIKKIRSSIRLFPNSEVMKCKVQTNGGSQLCSFLTKDGLKRLLAITRKEEAYEIAKELAMDLSNFRHLPTESETLMFIMDCFKGEHVTRQYKFGTYRVDLYFQEYNLVVECDEELHKYPMQRSLDNLRQKWIEEHFGVIFVRFRPQKNIKEISNVINKIHNVIVRHKIQNV
jgi:very-short-patch-repair endonuclease